MDNIGINEFKYGAKPHIDCGKDPNQYGEPKKLSLQLTHMDVFLDYFEDKKRLLFSLTSGQALLVDTPYLCAEIWGREVQVARFSKAFLERLADLRRKGYEPCSANVRFIVAWKGEQNESETAVLLADMELKKTDTL